MVKKRTVPEGKIMIKETFDCKRDDLTIRGKVYRPAPEEGQASPADQLEASAGEDHAAAIPAVILSHGFLANAGMCKTYAKLLAGSGFAAFIFDFCGGGLMSKSDGKTEDMTVFTEVDDLRAVYQYVKTLPYVDPERISLLGCSQGGLVSALAAKELDIEKLVLLYPAFCIPDDARAGKMMFYTFDPGNIPDILGKRPMKLGGDYARTVVGMDVYEEIRGFNGPVLLLHGTEDDIVDISYARKAKDCFPGCEYHELEGAGHMFRGEDDKKACVLIRDFME